MNFGQRLQAALDRAKKSRKNLADVLGVTPQAIGMVITGAGGKVRSLSAENSANAAKYLGVNPHWLATGDGDMLFGGLLNPEPKVSQIDPAPDMPGEASATAMEIALLYDLIPASDRVRRTKAYNAATAAILAVLEERPATE